MATPVDAVIVSFEAKLAKYNAELKNSTSLFERSIARQQKGIVSLERQIQQSSGKIGDSLRGMAGAFAGAFTAQQIGGAIDGFTRLQNSLRVSGLEGQKLLDVQGKLLALSGQYGVSINELANLYSKSSQAAGDLGGTSVDFLKITEASAQALKITGTSAAQAQGALLGLTQALSSGRVKAEEFNQINEGGLRPLLQVVANLDRFGGSVAKLRQEVVAGTVTSREFYQALLGTNDLAEKAAKAQLTLAGAFEALSSNFTVYIGTASQANGVTNALAGGIKLLADNLDIVVTAIAVIAAALGVGYTTKATLAAIATLRLSLASGALSGTALGAARSMGVMGAASFALQARMAGAATTTEALKFAMVGLSGALPFLAISALIGGLSYLVAEQAAADQAAANLATSLEEQAKQFGIATGHIRQANAETGNLTTVERAAAVATANLTGEANLLADAWARVAVAAKTAAIENARAALDTAITNQTSANAALDADRSRGTIFGLRVSSAGADPNRALVAQADQAERNRAAAQADLDRITKQKLATFRPGDVVKPAASSGATGAGRKRTVGAGPTGRAGPDLAEKQRREDESAANELRSLRATELRARYTIAANSEERADVEAQILALEREEAYARLDSNKDLSATQRAAQEEVIRAIYGVRDRYDETGGIIADGTRSLAAQIAARERAATENREALELEQSLLAIQQDELQYAYDIARSSAERYQIGQQIVFNEYRSRLASVDNALLEEGISDVKRKQLLAEKDALSDALDRNSERSARDNQGPLAKFRDSLNKTTAELDDEFQDVAVKGLQNLNDQLTDAILNSENLGDTFKNVAKSIVADLLRIAIQQAIIKPLADSLFSGGGSSSFGGALSSIFGGARAIGGPVKGGKVYRVNESGTEGFVPMGSGKIIPLGQMNAIAASGGKGGTSVIRLELSGDIDARMVSVAQGVSVEVTRAAAPAIIDASVSEVGRRSRRPGF